MAQRPRVVVVLSIPVFRLASFSFLVLFYTALFLPRVYKSVQISFAQNARAPKETITMPSRRRRPKTSKVVVSSMVAHLLHLRRGSSPSTASSVRSSALCVFERTVTSWVQSTIVRRAITGGLPSMRRRNSSVARGTVASIAWKSTRRRTWEKGSFW